MSTIAITYPSETMFSFELKSNYYFGIPVSVSPSGLAMDADRLITLVKSLDGDVEKPKQFMLSAGATGSALEHSVPEHLWSTPENPAYGISAVKALQIANDQGIPIYTINKDNINAILQQLQIDYDDKTDIKNAVNAGKIVTVSKANITFNGWTGCGYIVTDPNTGAAGYMISGGMSGSNIMAQFKLLVIGLYLLPSGRGFDEVLEALDWQVFKDTLMFEVDYVRCVMRRFIFGTNESLNFTGSTELLNEVLSAVALLKGKGKLFPLVYAGAWVAFIAGTLAITATVAVLGLSCKDDPNKL